ncbi:hypothetical protein AB0I35_32160, partial [Nocardia sp. NPDC050378]|uniref:hypothetical protein n=1 Tax=Nocardia sp. NPDC050378 TaxID=3155400 RepID=UPI00340ED1A5
MGALQLPGEELQPDVGGLELLGQGGELDATAQALVFVHDQGDRSAGSADLTREGDRAIELGASLVAH